MTTDEVKKIIDRIRDEAKVPTLSFTGGEPTLRDDLPELIGYAVSRGLRTNLITNGIRCAGPAFTAALADAGLHSAQVSLESHNRDVHDDIVGNRGAFDKTVAGIDNLKSAGIHTHTNTTVCVKNHRELIPLTDFVRTRFNAEYLSMNMIIATGIARDNDNVHLGYSEIGDIIRPVIRHCEMKSMKFVWYSPTPYCLFNPVDHGLGAKSCACVSGLLSVNPAGDVLPCSSYEKGIGNLLHHSFQRIWESDTALYYRNRRYIPPVCGGCNLKELCAGACPLYWENAGCFTEIEKVRGRTTHVKNWTWKAERGFRTRTRGVRGVKEKEMNRNERRRNRDGNTQ